MIEHTDNTHNKETVHIVGAHEAKAIIAHRLNGVVSSHRMFRIEVEIEKQDILKWLDSQTVETRFYFSGRDKQDIETAGIGIADSIHCSESLDHKYTFEHIRKHLDPEIPNLKYYGGFAFAPGHIDAEWQSFGACRFIIPRFQLLTNQNSTTLACNVLIDKKKPKDLDGVLHELEQLNFTGYREFSKPGKLISRTDTPDYDQWRTNLTRVIDEIKDGQYNKTVLARKVELHFENTLNPVAILASLKRLPSRRYDFMFQFDGKNAFVGSSPERLYKRTGRAILSEALAGTRSRGKKEQDDLRQAKELINSNKEQREHDFVAHTVKRELKPLCSSLETDEQKSLLKLKEGIHLISYLRGTLKQVVTDEMVIIALHPTPAVGGCPAGKALEIIRRSEPFKRGWYAGVVGTVGIDSADFAVGLRSGTIEGNRLSLYSGVGIVEGSNPEDEWREMDHKTANFMEIVSNNQ